MSVAVVTGAAGGLGGAMVAALGASHRIVAVDLSDRVDDVVAEARSSGIDAVAVRADLTSDAGIAAVVEACEGGVWCLVNNAGITRDARLVKMEDDQFAAVIAVNLGAVYRLSRAIVPLLVEGGSIVSISSRAYLGNFGQFNYSMSKGGVVGLTRALALELAPHGRANAIAPGLIETPMSLAIPDDMHIDTDGDGITDWGEELAGTNPADPDSDDDSLLDGDEIAGDTDPLTADI